MANTLKPVMNVVDVSKHNGEVDFNAIKEAGYEGVIIRAGYGKYYTQVDPMFTKNYLKAKQAGMHVGAYWYSYAQTGDDAMQEALVFMRALDGKQFDLPVYIDIEEACSKSKANEIVLTFCDALEEEGYFAGVYASRSYAQSYINKTTLMNYTFWCAEWGTTQCNYGGPYAMWQYSDKGKFKGMTADFDLNVCYVDFPSIIKKGGYNGYRPEIVDDFDEEIPEQDEYEAVPETSTIEILVNGETLIKLKGEII